MKLLDEKRHKDALANFNKNYVKTEIFPRKLGKRIAESEKICHASDYDDFYIATRDEAEEQIQTAKELMKLVEKYVHKRWELAVPEGISARTLADMAGK